MGDDWMTVAEYLFDSQIKKMSIIARHVRSEEYQIFTKGAVERILDACDTILSFNAPEGTMQLAEQAKTDILERMESMASRGLRVLAFSFRSNFEMPLRQQAKDGEDIPVPRDQVESSQFPGPDRDI